MYGILVCEPSLGDTFSLGTLGGSTKQQKGKPDWSRAAPKRGLLCVPLALSPASLPTPGLGHHIQQGQTPGVLLRTPEVSSSALRRKARTWREKWDKKTHRSVDALLYADEEFLKSNSGSLRKCCPANPASGQAPVSLSNFFIQLDHR